MDIDGTKAENEKLILCIWDEVLSLQQFGSCSSFILHLQKHCCQKLC